MEKITSMVQKAMHSEQTNEVEVNTQLKEKYSTARSEKIQILTALPRRWSIRRVEEEFGASNFMARKTKQLVREKGILSPDPKPGHTLVVLCDLCTSIHGVYLY